MFEINVNIKFPDLLLATSAICKALQSAKNVETAAAATPAISETAPAATPTGAAPTAPVAAPVAPTAPVNAPTYTLDQITKAGAELAQGGKLAQLQELLSRYGVQALPQLHPDSYGSVANDLRAMGAQL